jgi:hypothetical protein
LEVELKILENSVRLSPSCRLYEPEAGGFARGWIFIGKFPSDNLRK